MNTIESINSRYKKLKDNRGRLKRIFATLLASMVALTTATMSGSVYADTSFAYSATPNNTNGTDINSDGLIINTYSNIKAGSSVKDTYAFYVGTSCYFIGPSESPFYVYLTYNTDSITNTVTTSTNNSTYPDYYFGSTTVGSASDQNSNIPVYANVLSALAAFDEYYKSLPPEVVVTSSKKIEAGNVAILDFGNGVFNYDLTLTSYNYQKSGLLKGANVWNENGQAYYWSFTLPKSGDSVSGTQITWDKAPSALYPQDALGQTHYGIAEMTGTGAARYLLIINPYVNQISSMGKGEVNGWINIDGIPEGVGVYIYPMQQTITGLSNENVISPTEENPGGYGVATSQGGIIDTTTIGGEAPYTQTTGGANSSMPLATIGDYVEDINNTLSEFSQNFLNLLKAPIEYIKALVEGAQNFFQFIGGLFTWLPEDVGTFVITGLMIVVVVGIFHSLL